MFTKFIVLFQYTKLSPKDLQVARIIGITESVAVKLLSNNRIKVRFEKYML